MAPQYTPITTPPRPVKFRKSVVIVGIAAVLGLVSYALMGTEDPGARPPAEAPPSVHKPQLSGVVAALPQSYRDLPVEAPPAPDPPPPPPPSDVPAEPLPPPPSAAPPGPPPGRSPGQAPDRGPGQAAARRDEPTTPRQARAPEKPARWLMAKSNPQKPPLGKPRPDQARPEDNPGLLKPAKWVTPVQPDKVLYPEQVIPALTMQALNSDVPGTFRLLVTQHVVDLQTGNTVLIPQFSTIMGKWEEKPRYGDKRAQIKVQTLRLYGSGTLVDLTGGAIGGRDGASGIEADVNNHWLEVLAGAGISAMLSIGAQAPFGDVEGFYPSLAQDFARQAGSSLNRAGQKVVERELMRAPTLTQIAGYPVTVQLAEALSFQQPPKRSSK